VSTTPPASDSAPHEPRVTVVVPVRNERGAIGACLDSLLAQTEPDMQIIIVDGASDDGTPDYVLERARADPRIELHHNPQRTVPYAMNVALAATRARWLVRVDAHAAVPPGYVARAVELLESGDWGGVGGIKRGIGKTSAGKAVAAAMASPFGVGGSIYHYGKEPQEVEHVPFGAYPTEVARSIGGWGEEFTVNQDFEFDHRVREAGHKILFDPSLVIDWESRQSIRALWKQYRRYGKGKAKVVLRHPESIRPRHLLPPMFVGYLAAAGALAVVQRDRRGLAVLAVSPYALALAAASVHTGRTIDDAAARPLVPLAFMAMHIGWGVGFWEGLVHEYRTSRRR